MQRLSERLEAAAAAEQQLQDERLSRLRAVESLRETEAKLTAAQLRAAEAVEAFPAKRLGVVGLQRTANAKSRCFF